MTRVLARHLRMKSAITAWLITLTCSWLPTTGTGRNDKPIKESVVWETIAANISHETIAPAQRATNARVVRFYAGPA